jgi:hypothetical protein
MREWTPRQYGSAVPVSGLRRPDQARTSLWRPDTAREVIRWRARATVHKYWADDDLTPITALGPYGPRRSTPFEVIEGENLLLTVGGTLIMDRLTAVSSTALDATNARIAVGDSTTPASASQTDLQASTNKFRQVVDAAPNRSGATTQWVCTFGLAVANFAWNECGLANAASGANLVNRIVQNMGTKANTQQLVLTISATLA